MFGGPEVSPGWEYIGVHGYNIREGSELAWSDVWYMTWLLCPSSWSWQDTQGWGRAISLHWQCYNFLPFSCILPCLHNTIPLLPLCTFTWGDPPPLTCLPVVLLLLYCPSLVSYLITGLSLSLIISLMVVTFPQPSTKFYNLLLR